MKKLFWGIAALSLPAVMLATSCSDKDIIETAGMENQISFDAAIGRSTLPTSRVGEFTAFANEDGFDVTAWSASGLFQTFALSFDGSDWSYDGAAVNQPGFALSYYAYYNAEGAAAATESVSDASFDYTVQPAAQQEDLMMAAVPATTDNQINLVFKHLLSQVNFAVVPMTNMTVKIDNISVSGVQDEGTYSSAGGWSAQDGDASYDYDYTGTAIAANDAAIVDGVYYFGNGGGVTNKTNALMLLPQTFAGATFTFDYEIVDVTTSQVKFSDTDVEVDLADLGAGWELGKRYVYVIDLSALVVGGEIAFTVQVGGWENYNDPGNGNAIAGIEE